MRRRNLHSEVNEGTHKRRYRPRRTSSSHWLSTPRSRQAAITILFCLAPSLYWASTSSIYQSNGPTAFFIRRKRRGRTLVALRPEIQQLRRQFPIHANEMEEIPHPGILFSGSERAKILVPDLAFPDNLLVPKFWKPSGYGHEGVRHFLGDGGKKLMTPEEAQSIGSVTEDHKETIFVSLASYRDVECRSTLESIFLRATHPDRIRVSVVDQIEADDPKCSVPQVPCEQQPDQVLCTYRHLIDVFEVPSYLMVGPVFARHIAHRMYRGEYFVLQTDAHVRFTEGWDDDIISQWEATLNEMAILSTYLTDITDSIDPVTNASRRKDRNMLCHLSYEGNNPNQKHLIMKSPAKSVPTISGTPMLHPFWSAGFSFARGHFLIQVPYDPYAPMLFQGEESSIAVRAFTYGYDFYAPARSVCFHIFAIKSNIGRRQRHKFWEHETLYLGALEKSLARIIGITRMAGAHSPTEYFQREEELYGLGHVRPVDQFYATFGIDPETATVDVGLCSFVKEQMHRQFEPHLRGDGMGIDYDSVVEGLLRKRKSPIISPPSFVGSS